MNFAVIENGIVTNTVIAEDVETAEQITGSSCIEYTEGQYPHIGLGYVDGEFIQPTYPDGYFDELPTGTE